MLTPELEQLIEFALADGELTDKERAVLTRKAQEAGVDLDEFEMILDAKLHLAKKTSTEPVPSPKSNSKHGEVCKCPGCGATVSAFTTKCPECGFEFNNIGSIKSANNLFEKLQAIEMEKARELAKHDEEKNRQLQALSEKHNGGGAFKQFTNALSKERQEKEREDLIRTLEKGDRQIERKYLDAKINLIKVYTVPNTKGDLLELLSMAASSAYDNDGVIGPEEEVWLQKTDQIYQKLVICAADDKNFTRIPKQLRDKVNLELKAQKAEKKAEFKEAVMKILIGWRGITLGIAILALAIAFTISNGPILFGALIVIIVIGKMTWKSLKEAKEDILY